MQVSTLKTFFVIHTDIENSKQYKSNKKTRRQIQQNSHRTQQSFCLMLQVSRRARQMDMQTTDYLQTC